jgi:hypothetical protein
MKLTMRGQGVVAGLLIAIVTVLGITFGGGEVQDSYGDPVRVEQQEIIEEDEPGWDCTTMGNEYCGTDHMPQGATTNWDMDTASDMPATNPCPYAMQAEGICDGGF